MKQLLRNALLIDLAIIPLIGIISLQSGSLKFGTALIWAGIGAIVIGSMAAFGGGSIGPGEFNLKYDQKLPQYNYQRTPDKWSEMNKSYSFCLYMAVAGIIPIAVGLLINYIRE